jgi:putative redox protein
MSKVVAEIGDGTIVRLESRGHVWNADEPLEARGTDQAPNPYELLLSSLGACTTLTLRMYAQHKKIDLKSVRAEYTFDRVYGRDCRECGAEDDARLDVIRAHVTLRGTFDDAARKRLTEIVSRCPVHRTLKGGPKMFETVEFVD